MYVDYNGISIYLYTQTMYDQNIINGVKEE